MSRSPYCRVESENGETYEDASEDLLYELMRAFELPDNGHLIVEGVGDSDWYIVAALLEEGVYEIEFRDPVRGVHRIETGSRLSEIANDMIVWVSDTVRFHQARAAHTQPM
ncbi:hypothetical protein QRN89_10670 [Streptomyces chengbuensis]|uniref:hypothetical protein n=1 Tax=Streptomyces chengbuensis TaxID=3053466 RepID=UPI0025B5877D|nr:hypothetical protein [Streptomyces sp. HUAS CB01]WJY50243.1 hypothetical protein QRN89_10670 [Streptomyces sp. HUAS CB01]